MSAIFTEKPFYLHRFCGELMAPTGVVGAGFYWVTMIPTHLVTYKMEPNWPEKRQSSFLYPL